MSDRRIVLLLVAALTALAGAVLAVVSLAALGAPRWRGGDLGEEVDAGGVLTAALVLGLLLAAAGAVTVVGLVYAQLRTRARDRSGRIVP